MLRRIIQVGVILLAAASLPGCSIAVSGRLFYDRAMNRSMSISEAAKFARGGEAAVLARFWDKVDKSAGEHQCWPMRSSGNSGYSSFRVCGPSPNVTRLSHRVSWWIHYGEPNPTLVLNHRCGNRSCVNPLHLEQVTQRENTLHWNSSALAAVNHRKNSCRHGHEYDAENTVIRTNADGSLRQRVCRKCESLRNKKVCAMRRMATAARRKEKGWKPFNRKSC